jgi:C-terminal processing protease CtpA/Prc
VPGARPTRSVNRASALLWAIVLGTGLLAQPSGLSSADRDLALVMLRQIRDDVRAHYYDPAFHGVDLASVFAATEQRLKTAPTLADAMALISDALFQFDDSHTAFLPPDRQTRVDYGWQMAAVGDEVLVTTVDPAGDAAAKGVAPGDRVLLLNAFEPTRANLVRLGYFYRFIRPQAQQRLGLLKPDGSARTVDVLSRLETKRTADLGELLDDLGQLAERARDRSGPAGDGILVWKMPAFRQPESIDAMIRQSREYKTLVLDLRGNGGGSVAALKELVSRCIDHPVVVALERARGKESREIARPKSGFAGRLVVLVDSRSASAAEMFARIVQIEKRGDVLGDRTSGQVMTSRLFPHAIGAGRMLFYASSVTVSDVRMSDGGSLEKTGVEPDEIVLPRPSDLAADRDPVLARAIALAGGAITPEEAGRLFK